MDAKRERAERLNTAFKRWSGGDPDVRWSHLAKAAGVKAYNLSRWKDAVVAPGVDDIAKLAYALGVTKDWLAWGEGEMLAEKRTSGTDAAIAAGKKLAGDVAAARRQADRTPDRTQTARRKAGGRGS